MFKSWCIILELLFFLFVFVLLLLRSLFVTCCLQTAVESVSKDCFPFFPLFNLCYTEI